MVPQVVRVQGEHPLLWATAPRLSGESVRPSVVMAVIVIGLAPAQACGSATSSQVLVCFPSGGLGASERLQSAADALLVPRADGNGGDLIPGVIQLQVQPGGPALSLTIDSARLDETVQELERILPDATVIVPPEELTCERS
jgi:hypothetical protein